MKNYVKSFAVLAIALLCSTVVLAQNDELYGWEKVSRYRGFLVKDYYSPYLSTVIIVAIFIRLMAFKLIPFSSLVLV